MLPTKYFSGVILSQFLRDAGFEEETNAYWATRYNNDGQPYYELIPKAIALSDTKITKTPAYNILSELCIENGERLFGEDHELRAKAIFRMMLRGDKLKAEEYIIRNTII